MALTKLSQIKSKGLVIYDRKKYTYVLQDEIAKHEIEPDSTLRELVKLNTAVAVLQKQPKRIFIDYNQLVFEDKETLKGRRIGKISTRGRTIVVHDSNKFYSVSETLWKHLPDEGDAQVLVRRGAVVAVIPHSGILSGTYCVLVNMTSLGK